MRFSCGLRWLLAGLTVALLACSSTPLSRSALDGGGGGGEGGGSGSTGEVDASGAAGQAADAAAGTGGPSTVPPLPSSPSAGCNKAPGQALGQFVSHSVHVTGATLDPTFKVAPHERAFMVRLPPAYDPAVPRRTVFVTPLCQATGATGNLIPGDPEAIFVGLAAPPTSVVPSGCVDSGAGARSNEWEFFSLVVAEVERSFCVDRNDEVVAGTRSSATMANMLGCYFSAPDPGRAFGPALALRGQFSVASGLPPQLPACGGPIAALWLHDKTEVNPVTDSTASLERVLKQNGCADSPTEAWGTNELTGIGCKKFSACPTRFPVVFCETTGMGRQSNYNRVTVPAFKQFVAQWGAAR